MPADGQVYGASLEPGERSPAPYSAGAIASRGRAHVEADCPTRNTFQRDRDRVLHSAPFRRLTYKTQVFLFHEGDHYRTRLTHSLEVAQIARTICRQLRLDEDLAEALALAHDLGHSPFGHAGERALDKAMQEFGGFDHNAQSLRVVTQLERKYLAFDGLNLAWETLEGLAKHNGPLTTGADEGLNGDGSLPVLKVARAIERGWRALALDGHASGEAQVASLADDIAYLNHDIDDGLRAGLITLDDVADVPVAGDAVCSVTGLEGATSAVRAGALDARLIYEVTRRMITTMINDCISRSRLRLAALAPQSPDDIRAASGPIVGFSEEMDGGITALRSFLFDHVYRHPRVMGVMTNAEMIVTDLFQRYLETPAELEPQWRHVAETLNLRKRARLTGDFVAGMTDRFAIAEHQRLFDATPELR